MATLAIRKVRVLMALILGVAVLIGANRAARNDQLDATVCCRPAAVLWPPPALTAEPIDVTITGWIVWLTRWLRTDSARRSERRTS